MWLIMYIWTIYKLIHMASPKILCSSTHFSSWYSIKMWRLGRTSISLKKVKPECSNPVFPFISCRQYHCQNNTPTHTTIKMNIESVLFVLNFHLGSTRTCMCGCVYESTCLFCWVTTMCNPLLMTPQHPPDSAVDNASSRAGRRRSCSYE